MAAERIAAAAAALAACVYDGYPSCAPRRRRPCRAAAAAALTILENLFVRTTPHQARIRLPRIQRAWDKSDKT